MSQSTLARDEFADQVPPILVDVEAYDNRINLIGVPLLDSVPDSWSDIRLRLGTSLVRALSIGLTPVLSNVTTLTDNSYIILDIQTQVNVYATDTTIIGWTTCATSHSILHD